MLTLRLDFWQREASEVDDSRETRLVFFFGVSAAPSWTVVVLGTRPPPQQPGELASVGVNAKCQMPGAVRVFRPDPMDLMRNIFSFQFRKRSRKLFNITYHAKPPGHHWKVGHPNIMSYSKSEADVIFNRANLALAKSQRLVASWLPPKSAEENAADSLPEHQAVDADQNESEVFHVAPEQYVLGYFYYWMSRSDRNPAT